MKRTFYFIISVILLCSCFKDTGNYDYSELNPPHWVKEMGRFSTYAGGTAHFDGRDLFVWATDSLKRASEVRYEWELNGVVIGEGIEFDIPTEELMRKANIKQYTLDKAPQGIFRIIEKSTGVSFPRRFLINLFPYYASYDWFMLVDKNNEAEIATLRRRASKAGKSPFTLQTDAFAFHNDGKKMVGKPIEMTWSYAKHIGVYGSFTITTDKEHYLLDGTNLKHVGNLNDEFLDGTPANFKPVHRADIDVLGEDGRPTTFVATEDGKVYTRIMGPSYLGGKFLSEPYEVDSKGYKVTMFGTGRFGSHFLCLDELNNRLLYARQWISRLHLTPGSLEETSVYTTQMNTLKDVPSLPISNLGDDIEIVAMRGRNHYGEFGSFLAGKYGVIYTIFYNKKSEPKYTYCTDIVVDSESLRTKDLPFKNVVLPRIHRGDPLLTTSIIRRDLTATEAARRVLFVVGDKLMYYTQSQNYMVGGFEESGEFEYPEGPKPTSKITQLAYDYFDCGELMIGCENGDYFLYNIEQFKRPRLLTHGNAGGKILGFREGGIRTLYHDR